VGTQKRASSVEDSAHVGSMFGYTTWDFQTVHGDSQAGNVVCGPGFERSGLNEL